LEDPEAHTPARARYQNATYFQETLGVSLPYAEDKYAAELPPLDSDPANAVLHKKADEHANEDEEQRPQSLNDISSMMKYRAREQQVVDDRGVMKLSDSPEQGLRHGSTSVVALCRSTITGDHVALKFVVDENAQPDRQAASVAHYCQHAASTRERAVCCA